MFDSLNWAASMLSCGDDEAEARLKLAKNELEIRDAKKYRRGMESRLWPSLIENGGSMARLRSLADGGDADAASTVQEIEMAFLRYSQEKDTDKYALKLLCQQHGLQMVIHREFLQQRIFDNKGLRTRKNFLFTLACGCPRTKHPHAEEARAAAASK